MSLLRTLPVFAFVFSLALHSEQALAECAEPPAASLLKPGEIGLFFDRDGTETCSRVPTREIFLVARVPAGGIQRYDLSALEWDPETLPPGNLVVRSQLPTEGPYVEGVIDDGCDFAHAKEGCPSQENDVLVLARYELLSLEPIPNEWTTCLMNLTCASIAGERPHTPTFDTCTGPVLQQFAFAENLCLTWSFGPTASQTKPWSFVKTLYQ